MRTLSLGSTIVICLLAGSAIAAAKGSAPDSKLTPGVLCSSDSDDFKGYAYPEKVALCERNVGRAEKKEVADSYEIVSEDEWSNYEFDHLIPLCAGGGNDEENIWPQPIDEAKEKDKLEDSICRAMKAGTMTQAEAVQKVHEWFEDQDIAVGETLR